MNQSTRPRSRSQELALAKLREEGIGDVLDLTAHTALISLANGELPGWNESRDGLLKKLEVCSIIGSLIAAVCLTVILQPLESSSGDLFKTALLASTPVGSTAAVCVYLYLLSAMAGAVLCMACVLRAFLLQAHLLMFTPGCVEYINFLCKWEFDIVDIYLCYGILALMTCLPCGAFVIFGNYVGIAVVAAEWVLIFKIWNVWREMLDHNSAVLFEKEEELLQQEHASSGEDGTEKVNFPAAVTSQQRQKKRATSSRARSRSRRS
jgi:hypothetical protein